VSEQILSLAKAGDPDAIAFLINQAWAKKNISATTRLVDKCLHVRLTGRNVPPQNLCVYVISEGMKSLGIASIEKVEVEGKAGRDAVAWSQTIDLLSAKVEKLQVTSLPPEKIEPKFKPKFSLLWLSGIVLSLGLALGIVGRFQSSGSKQTKSLHQAAVVANKPARRLPVVASNKPVQQEVLASNKRAIQQQKSNRPRGNRMVLKRAIAGKISPKSIVHSGAGLFFAQNMMYRHTITVYNRQFKLVRTISDRVNLAKYGYEKFAGTYQGAPVEASFSDNGKYAWVSNYQMYGRGFNNPGSDRCSVASGHDRSFLYRINTETFQIERAIRVGAVPKFVATSPDNRLVLVSNWCSWDLSVVDSQANQEIKRIKLGAYPRGIVVSPDGKTAYVAVMGSSNIARVDLNNYRVRWLRNIGRSPRHLNLDPAGKYLYASLNGEGKLAKIDLSQGKVIDKVTTGNAPRSMVLSDDGERLYVVNYGGNTVSKVRTQDMKVLQTVKVAPNPIGITYDPQTRQVWVACYSGQIMVFQD
jgi:YVTN family beta-propeller protein